MLVGADGLHSNVRRLVFWRERDFDVVSQIHMDRWSRGRVLLIDNAAACNVAMRTMNFGPMANLFTGSVRDNFRAADYGI